MSLLGGSNELGGGGRGGSSGSGAVDSVNGQTGAVVLTSADVGAVDNQSTLTGLTGGAATDLDSLTTAGVDVGWVVALQTGSGLEHWQLQAGTDAENAAGGIVRPDDYATTTNEKIWVRIG